MAWQLYRTEGKLVEVIDRVQEITWIISISQIRLQIYWWVKSGCLLRGKRGTSPMVLSSLYWQERAWIKILVHKCEFCIDSGSKTTAVRGTFKNCIWVRGWGWVPVKFHIDAIIITCNLATSKLQENYLLDVLPLSESRPWLGPISLSVHRSRHE